MCIIACDIEFNYNFFTCVSAPGRDREFLFGGKFQIDIFLKDVNEIAVHLYFFTFIIIFTSKDEEMYQARKKKK